MNAKITFFPIGNADTTLIQLSSGKNILWDYADKKSTESDDKRCDLPYELNKRMTNDYYDVVCFTHADEDHICKMSEYFYLEHDKKFQDAKRKKIKELWVPAAIILHKEFNNDDDKILQAEARYRLKRGQGIKVFSKPDKLKDWLSKEGISLDKVKNNIVDAGTLVPGWNKYSDGIEFFVHSPFSGHVDDIEVADRNESGIIVQSIFGNQVETKFILGADGYSDTWKDIVKTTRYHKHDDRLKWDVFHISHHCSYTALNREDKGKQKTEPVDEVKWLFEVQGNVRGIIISPSNEITFSDTDQPPHFQAFNYYKQDVINKKRGQIEVTMEFPKKSHPEPLEMEISDNGPEIVRKNPPATVYVKTESSPRVG